MDTHPNNSNQQQRYLYIHAKAALLPQLRKTGTLGIHHYMDKEKTEHIRNGIYADIKEKDLWHVQKNGGIYYVK